MAGMGPSPLAMPTQLAASLHSKSQFALCLPSTTYAPGVAFFGDGPFFMMPPPGLNLATALSYTPLFKNPTNPVYYINVKAIKINGALALNFPASSGLVKLSTVAPYTVLKAHLYRTFIHAFAMETLGIPQAPPVKPFDLCLNTTILGSTRVGLPIPQVDLMLANGRNWTMFEANSMKQVSDGVACLAVVDGGERAAETAMIGWQQLQDNFLLFDLERSRL